MKISVRFNLSISVRPGFVWQFSKKFFKVAIPVIVQLLLYFVFKLFLG